MAVRGRLGQVIRYRSVQWSWGRGIAESNQALAIICVLDEVFLFFSPPKFNAGGYVA